MIRRFKTACVTELEKRGLFTFTFSGVSTFNVHTNNPHHTNNPPHHLDNSGGSGSGSGARRSLGHVGGRGMVRSSLGGGMTVRVGIRPPTIPGQTPGQIPGGQVTAGTGPVVVGGSGRAPTVAGEGGGGGVVTGLSVRSPSRPVSQSVTGGGGIATARGLGLGLASAVGLASGQEQVRSESLRERTPSSQHRRGRQRTREGGGISSVVSGASNRSSVRSARSGSSRRRSRSFLLSNFSSLTSNPNKLAICVQ